MPRYIDADVLEYQVEKHIAFEKLEKRNKAYIKGLRDFGKILSEQPTADVVEVVRCKRCKHRLKYRPMYSDDDFYCETDNMDAFCSYGERRK